MVTSAAQIFGKIGAAKSFSKVANALDIEENAQKIYDLQTELQDQTKTADERRFIERSIKRLAKKNKMLSRAQKQYQNATDFLSKLADTLDIGINFLLKWIANFLVCVMPALELSVKMLLLSNIKKMLGCSIDPMIPDYWRYEGVLLNEAQVDPRKMLRLSPYSKFGKYRYFGCYDDKEYMLPKEENELARAEDMNAFMWYAKHKTFFVSPIVISPDDMPNHFNGVVSGDTFFDKHEFVEKDGIRYVAGTAFKNSPDGTTIFMLEKKTKNKYTILPASDRWTGITWYKDRNSMTGLEKSKPNYDKSKPLFNIEFLGKVEGNTPSQYRYGNFRFRILPKPFSTAGGFIVDLENNLSTMASVAGAAVSKEVIGDEIDTDTMPKYQYQGIQSPIPYYARFNGKGDYDRRGRYSINMQVYDVVKIRYDEDNKVIQYGIYDRNGSRLVAYLDFLKKNKTFVISNDASTDNIGKAPQNMICGLLGECYFGNTVYEFNYDYVMSMKLFDAKAITSSIIDSLLHMKFDIDLSSINPFLKSGGENTDTLSDTDQIYIDSYVDRLIEKMIDTEEKEYTDCFYTFSNEDYERMEQETADKVTNMAYDIDNGQGAIEAIYNDLNAYDADATLNEKTECIEKALLGAVAACGFNDSNGLDTNDTYNRRNKSSGLANAAGERSGLFKMIKTILEVLVSSIVNAILTPKVLMLIQVNRMMMLQNAFSGQRVDEFEEYSVKDVLGGMSGLIQGVIRNVVDTIHREVLKMILERLSEIMAAYLKKLGIEYAMKWVNILKELLACFKRDRSAAYADNTVNPIYRGSINSIIDEVNYADLEILADEIIPNTNPC